MEKSTNTLTSILKKTSPDKISEYMSENNGEMIDGGKPFACFMRQIIKQKGLQQQQVFLDADISMGYGYKIISEEKHTRQRDIILRLCLASDMNLDEIQRALKIYGMSPLYPRISRDALIIVAVNSGIKTVTKINEYLENNGEKPLKGQEMTE